MDAREKKDPAEKDHSWVRPVWAISTLILVAIVWWILPWSANLSARYFGFPFVALTLYYIGRQVWRGYRREILGPPSGEETIINYLKDRRFRFYIFLAFLVLLTSLSADLGILGYIWPKLDCLRVHTVGECETFFRVKSLFP